MAYDQRVHDHLETKIGGLLSDVASGSYDPGIFHSELDAWYQSFARAILDSNLLPSQAKLLAKMVIDLEELKPEKWYA